MALYTESLNGIVLLSGRSLESAYAGPKHRFTQLCERLPELHFPSLTAQIEQLKADLTRADGTEGESRGSSRPLTLKNGDFYLTRHSSLAEHVHSLFRCGCVSFPQLKAKRDSFCSHLCDGHLRLALSVSLGLVQPFVVLTRPGN
jgi:hypothetical protein